MQNLLDLVNSLNPMQRSAVELPAEHALILAGAGSGKTRVLTTRIAWIIAKGMARPAQILAVTFTNKAAREMRDRLEGMVNADMRSMWVGTFHGIAHKLLRLHCEDAGLPSTFQIIDSSDQLSLVKRLMKEQGVDTETNDARSWQARINRFKEAGLRAKEVAAEEEPLGGQGFYRLYENRCQKEGLVDFAELLLRSTELLERNAVLREHYADRFRFVLVDEFQDTNALQFRWIKAIVSPASTTNSLFCVGDDDQSIYAFRGARVGNMADFVNDYHVKHLVKLEQNYRSTSHILDAANAVIANNAQRMGKNLWTEAGKGELIGIYGADDDREEARSLTQDILTLHRSGTPWRDCAVLYRNNAQSRIIEQYFTANSIPYRIYGGLRFFDRQEVKDVTAYLRLLSNPEDTSVLRVINQPPRGIGATTIERITAHANERGVTLWEAMHDWQAEDTATVKRAAGFMKLVADMKEACEGLPLPEVIAKVMEMSGLKIYYESKPDHDIRLENMGEMVNAATGFCRENGIDEEQPAFEAGIDNGMTPLDGFLAQAALEADDKNEEGVSDSVQMMTVHASKGLEFPNVWLCGLEDGLFPHHARDEAEEDKAISEERRLMYVAMTRAQKRLRISWCAQRMLYGDIKYQDRSQFIDEIPEEHVRELKVPKKDDDAGDYRGGYGGSRYGSYGNGGYSRSYGNNGYSRGGYAGRDNSYGARSSGYGQKTERSSGWQGGKLGRASDYLAASRASGAGFSSDASIAARKESTSNEWGLSVGDKVHHTKFGDGVIVSMANVAKRDQTRAQIKFTNPAYGTKELLLAFANLTKL